MRRAHYSNVTERPMTSFVWDTNATTKEEVEAMVSLLLGLWLKLGITVFVFFV